MGPDDSPGQLPSTYWLNIPGCFDTVSSPCHHDASGFATTAAKTMDNCVPFHNYIGPEVAIPSPGSLLATIVKLGQIQEGKKS